MTEAKIPWLKNSRTDQPKFFETVDELVPAEYYDDVAANNDDVELDLDVNEVETRKFVPEYGYDALFDDMIFPS